MKNIFYLATLFTLLIGCNNDDNTEGSFTPQTIIPIVIAQSDYGGIYIFDMNPYNNYFNNENDWNLFKENHLSTPSDLDNIDFNSYTIIVCVDYARPTLGYSIDFNSIIEYQNEIIANINYIDYGGAAQQPSRPFIIVKIPKTEKPIVFE